MNTTDDNILKNLTFLCAMTPNDQELGRKVRAAYKDSLKSPERICDIEDEDCISCGA
tara:strand:+ start:667 stop:837 length:171 start_codon:yes stop_codon:yes gene_type:complete